MSLAEKKLELIQKIIACEDEELLQRLQEILKDEKSRELAEGGTTYGIEDEEIIDLSELSPEFQQAIKVGVEQAERGECVLDEEGR